MSQHQAFRRTAVPAQVMQKMDTLTLPAPTRGIIESENYAYMQPGSANVLDNWVPTMKGIRIRGGHTKWCDLHHGEVNPVRKPVISAFNYVSTSIARMFAAQSDKLFDVTFSTPSLIRSGQNSGNYSAAQLANMGGDWLIAVNDAGDIPLRFNGTIWTVLDYSTPANWAISTAYAVDARARDTSDNSRWKCKTAHTSASSGTFAADRVAHPAYWDLDLAADNAGWITGPQGSPVENGENLTYVCKYRGRLFFIEGGSMNAWYLPTDAIGGALQMIPLSGAATKGGRLLFCATWSIDAGDGIDDKLVFCTTEGELLVFTGSNPSDAANWRQEGRYQVGKPLGMNAHIPLGGDLLIATTDGIVPVSAAITKDAASLELAMVTKNIKNIWRAQASDKDDKPWTMARWDEWGVMLVTWPGGRPGERWCGCANTASGAWARLSLDATCWLRLYHDLFFGNQDGWIMQAERTGYDDGKAYHCVMVGGWEMFQSPSQTVTWRQARANFIARKGEPFIPQLTATTDYVIDLPIPPPPGIDPGIEDVWDEGLWDQAKWDAVSLRTTSAVNTGWVSVGVTGFSHAPVLQVTIAQTAKPNIELISIAATFERLGVTV